MLYAYRAVMAVGVGILYDFPILYFVLLAISTLALSTFVFRFFLGEVSLVKL